MMISSLNDDEFSTMKFSTIYDDLFTISWCTLHYFCKYEEGIYELLFMSKCCLYVVVCWFVLLKFACLLLVNWLLTTCELLANSYINSYLSATLTATYQLPISYLTAFLQLPYVQLPTSYQTATMLCVGLFC